MLVAIQGFGSVWRNSFGKDEDDPRRFVRAVYRNTTGVRVEGVLRTRPRIKGHVRFNGVGGFDPHHLNRMINCVFDCEPLCIWQSEFKMLFKCRVRYRCRPDLYLVSVTQDQIGRVALGSTDWKSEFVSAISFSEDHDQQEMMLLMPPYSWVRTSIGRFVLELAHPPSVPTMLQLVGD